MITTEVKKDSLVIYISEFDKPDCMEELKTNIKNWLVSPHKNFIFDFRNANSLHNKYYQPFIGFQRQVESLGKSIYSANMNSDVTSSIMADGMNKVFCPVQSLSDLQKQLGLVGSGRSVSVDVNVINPFIESTLNTFDVQLSTPLQIGKPALGKPEHNPEVDIVAYIDLSCPQFKGILVVCFSQEVLFKVYQKLLGEVPEGMDEDVKSALGEIANIIYGGAKTVLNKADYELSSQLPQVLIGVEIDELYKKKAAAMVLPFKSELGDFHVEVLAA